MERPTLSPLVLAMMQVMRRPLVLSLDFRASLDKRHAPIHEASFELPIRLSSSRFSSLVDLSP